MVDLPQRKDSSLRQAFSLLLEVEVFHHQGSEEGDLCRRVLLRPGSSKEVPSRFREAEHCNLGQYSKSDMHGNQAAPVTGRVLAEGVWDGYFCIPQKRPHSLDRQSFTMIFQSHIDSSQHPKSENPPVAILKHVTPIPPAFSPIGDYQTESPFHISDRSVRPFLQSHLSQTLQTSPQWQPQSQPSMPKFAPAPSCPTSALHVRPSLPQHNPKRTPEDSLQLTPAQISGVQHPISVSPSPPSWTHKKIQLCTSSFPPLLSSPRLPHR